MHLLLLSATDLEISETATWLNNHALDLNALKPKLLIGGIGQLQSAYALQNRIRLERPSLVIQAGIGGSPDKDDMGKVCAIGTEKMGDLGVMEKAGFTDIFGMGLENPDRFPFRDGKLENPYKSLLEWTGLPVLDGITVNSIRSTDVDGFQLNPLRVVESMEGAALHYVCLQEGVPFLQLRGVSNKVGVRDKTQWDIRGAIAGLNRQLSALLGNAALQDQVLSEL